MLPYIKSVEEIRAMGMNPNHNVVRHQVGNKFIIYRKVEMNESGKPFFIVSKR